MKIIHLLFLKKKTTIRRISIIYTVSSQFSAANFAASCVKTSTAINYIVLLSVDAESLGMNPGDKRPPEALPRGAFSPVKA